MIIDVFSLILIAYFGIRGFIKGLINLLIDSLGLYGACVIAWLFNPMIYQKISSQVAISENIGKILSFFIVWLISYLSIIVIGRLVSTIFNISIVGMVNRSLGMFLGMIKGLIIVIFIVTGIGQMNLNITP